MYRTALMTTSRAARRSDFVRGSVARTFRADERIEGKT